MMSSLTLYTHPMSRGRTARWMLEEIGVPYESVVFSDFSGAMKAADYLAINPMGKVPALKHGDTVITECAAICAYLADAFPEKGLAPALNDPQRGVYYRWLFFAAAPLEAAMMEVALQLQPKESDRTALGYGNLPLCLNTLEQTLQQHDFLCGNRFSAADLYLAEVLDFGIHAVKVIEAKPVFTDYIARQQARASYARATKIDDDLFAEISVNG
ncbi:glutathione S-transferase family protein [Testudinibacter sp. TR-2022]|nr:glutathione S-transferase family protein [Testudinibacter sp. TR-2022]TNH07839.1 glutathione S-transferase family protein [Pasteurellaceae bacterium Phil11]TNH24629.1 glutathione S-transferase family protein [Testudinibacter sp. TR-2022]TNH28117.1 glutathione S-transferase family protein [Testudinibacter sp. TR-2022]